MEEVVYVVLGVGDKEYGDVEAYSWEIEPTPKRGDLNMGHVTTTKSETSVHVFTVKIRSSINYTYLQYRKG